MIGRSAPISEALGQLGSNFINDNALYNGSWGIIQCIGTTNVSFTTLTSGGFMDQQIAAPQANYTNDEGQQLVTALPANPLVMQTSTNLNQIVLQPGMIIFGYFTQIQLTAGSIIAYNV